MPALKSSARRLVLGLLVLAGGCAGPRVAGVADGRPPYVLVHYYPFTVSGVRTVAAPVPDYSGWDEARMRRDLDRLARAGVDVVMVSLEPNEAREPARMATYLEFVARAARYRLEVAFMAEAQATPAEDVQAFGAWCASNLPGRAGYFHYEGRPLVEIYDALEAENYDHEALTVRHTVWAKEWYWGPHGDDAPPLSANGEQAMAFAGFMKNGDRPEEGFLVEREHGERLRRQFRGAAATGARFICVASYNDFWEGHFIEPNTLDGDALLRVLTAEIARLRDLGRAYGPGSSPTP